MAKLVINPTSASKKEIPIASRVISIGRDPSNDLVLSDSMVSRRHAILEQRDEIFVLRDNNSSNGTMVNGDKVDAEKTLRDGDLLAIGSSRLLFQLDDGAVAGSHPSLPPLPAIKSAALDELADVSTEGDLGPSRFAPSGAASPSGTISCPSCGNEARAVDRFCRSCGSELHEKTSVNCTACGIVVPLPAEFCGNCGHELPKKPRATLPTRHLKREDLLAEAPLADDGDGSPSPPAPSPSPVPSPTPGARAAAGPGRPRPRPAKASREEEEAGFGIRAIAALVDAMILGIPFLLVSLVSSMFAVSDAGGPASGGVTLLVSIVFPLVSLGYHVFFWAFHGATPGKSLLGLSVQSESGDSPIGVPTAVLRMLGYFASSFVLGIGFLLIAFTDDKRGLHDRIAGTRVMRHL